MEAQTITLTGPKAWADFAAANADALHAECVDLDDACALARRGELRLGGGAAPLIVVTLVGDEHSAGGQA